VTHHVTRLDQMMLPLLVIATIFIHPTDIQMA